MKAAPTLEGGLKIDTEDASDWELLYAIIRDANGCEADLASRLGGSISEEAGNQDWQDYVVPDLREEFQDALNQVSAAIDSARFRAHSEAGPLWITREDAFLWYSALNQARLALEDQYHFDALDQASVASLTPEQFAAYIRSDFYSHIQGLLLEYVLV
jgi:hypothetical protein